MHPDRIPAFLEDDLAPCPPEDARFHVLSAPLEQTVSYGGGTAGGPRAILEASVQLETWFREGVPGEQGIHTAPPVPCRGREVESILADVGAQALQAVQGGAIPLLLGGEHTVTYGPVRALHDAGYSFGVVQIDAHADLRDTYQGSPFSHACVMRRVVELGIPVYQIGVRSTCLEDLEVRRDKQISHLDAEPLHRHGIDDLHLPAEFPENIYLTFDLDGLDPSIMPSTGTPEPGGLDWYAALDCINRVLQGRTLLAADVVELAPRDGQHAPDFLAAKLVYAIMAIGNR